MNVKQYWFKSINNIKVFLKVLRCCNFNRLNNSYASVILYKFLSTYATTLLNLPLLDFTIAIFITLALVYINAAWLVLTVL